MSQSRGFRSLAMAATCGFAALGCYLVSLRVASERAALEAVETRIVLAQRDVRLLQTEIGTRGRLSQLERWNVKVLALSAPSADQFLKGGFELARLARPDRSTAFDAPVVLAAAEAPAKPGLGDGAVSDTDSATPVAAVRAVGAKLSQASLETPARNDRIQGTREVPVTAATAPPVAAAKSKDRPATAATPAKKESKDGPGLAAAKPRERMAPAKTPPKKSVDKPGAEAASRVTKPQMLAKADPLAPLPEAQPSKPRKEPAPKR